MTVAAAKKVSSIHDLPVNWKDMGDRYGAEAKIPSKDGSVSKYSVCLYVGHNCGSLPNIKLNSPQQYGELEVHFYKRGQAIAPLELLEQVLMPDELKRTGLSAGYVQQNINHKMLIKILSAIALIASME